jgi:hypothetical protein
MSVDSASGAIFIS